MYLPTQTDLMYGAVVSEHGNHLKACSGSPFRRHRTAHTTWRDESFLVYSAFTKTLEHSREGEVADIPTCTKMNLIMVSGEEALASDYMLVITVSAQYRFINNSALTGAKRSSNILTSYLLQS